MVFKKDVTKYSVTTYWLYTATYDGLKLSPAGRCVTSCPSTEAKFQTCTQESSPDRSLLWSSGRSRLTIAVLSAVIS